MRSRSTLAAALAAIAIAVPVAGAQPTPAQPPTTHSDVTQTGNAYCPVMPDDAIDPNFSTMYEGRTVFLCCKRCLTKFEASPTAYIANLPPLAQPAAFDSDVSHSAQSQGSEADGGDHDHRDQHDGAETAESAEHDHAEHAEGADGLTRTLSYLGRFHVMAVHFPIALLLVGALFELVSLVRPLESAPQMVRASIGLGAVSAVAAAALGLMNAIGADYAGVLGDAFWWHRALGLTVSGLAVVAWAAVEWRTRRPSPNARLVARTTVLATALLVGVVGHLGGSLVFGWEYLVP